MSAPHAADTHDLIRVHGARQHNLRDVSVEPPKRRLTVFTGVSGSGKSSLVFGTIAAESQRLINETYSAFLQGFMQTLARPDVDVLDGLTTAIIVDQQRMGADPRSTVGTATDANAMLRILFSRLGQPQIGSPQAFSFNVASISGAGAVTVERGGRTTKERRSLRGARRHVPALRGARRGERHRPDPPVRRLEVAGRGRDHGARLQRGRLVRPHLHRLRVPRPRQADPRLHEARARRPAAQGADQDQGRQHQPHLRGAHPLPAEVDAVEGRRVAAAAHPHVRRAGGDVHDLPGLRRHAAQRGASLVPRRRPQHRRGVRHADQRPGTVGARPRRAVGGTAAHLAAADARLVRRHRARLPRARATGRHAERRRGPAGQDDPAPRLVVDRRHLRVRRADDGPAPARRAADERACCSACATRGTRCSSSSTSPR
nr:hypothetical protein [Angustibacter aerolatus]